MAIVDNDGQRLKITDEDGDSIIVHHVESDGSVVVTCHDGDHAEYAAVHLTNEERLALIERLTR